jgi:hypothetical protein
MQRGGPFPTRTGRLFAFRTFIAPETLEHCVIGQYSIVTLVNDRQSEGSHRSAVLPAVLQRSLEQRRSNQECSNAEDKQKEQISANRNETSVLEHDRFEAVDRVCKGIDDRDGA